MAFNVLILGASYGSLLSTKLLAAGHNVRLVCLPEEVELINRKGTRVYLPAKGTADTLTIDSSTLPGRLSTSDPSSADPAEYHLVVLAMQEPQYRNARTLMQRIADARTPCMSIMNMPPLPYLKRLSGLSVDSLKDCFADADLWISFDPGCFTLCSPDPQAFRPPEEGLNVLKVTLPTNFKAARFERDEHTSMLRRMQADIEAIRYGPGKLELPVKLKVHDSLFVPLAKWAMLLAGNYRCVGEEAPRSIRDAVHGNLAESRSVYEWVVAVCTQLGASESDLVPFDKYATAAQQLTRPSSVARALLAGAPHVERVDRLVQRVGGQFGMSHPDVDSTVRLVDAWIAKNRSPNHHTPPL